jgi:hypothetical protein
LDLIRAFRAEDAVVDATSQEKARAALLERIAGSANLAPRKRWGWLHRRSRPVAILLVALVIAASAAAAVLSFTRSQPLAGRVPGAVSPASLAGFAYAIRESPSIQPGWAGWQVWIVYSRPGTSGYGQMGKLGGFGYPTTTTPVFGSGGLVDDCVQCYARGTPVEYVLTSPQVFAVRIGSQTIRTVSSPALPTGDRVAVFFIHAKGRVDVIPVNGPVPAGKLPPGVKVPPGRMKNVIFVLPLDRSGRVIPTRFTPRAYPEAGRTSTWMAPDASTRWWRLDGIPVPYHGRGYHQPPHPGPGVCELAQHGLPALHAQFGQTIAWLTPVKNALGEVFLPCANTAYYLHGSQIEAAVLLDGHHPGQVLGPIPGARPVPGQPGIVDLPTGQFPTSLGFRNFGLTAKRVGNAWLVARGGYDLAQRVQALNALQISKLDLHRITSGHAPH